MLVTGTESAEANLSDNNTDMRDMTRKTYSLVIGATEMLRMKEKISDLYPGRDIVLTPCLTKLYLSRELKIFDFDGKSSPNWFYFATGIVAIIYDKSHEDLLITLFDCKEVRLLWCLKWADYIRLHVTTSQFHILNTKSDFSNHVGILYDNKDVADLILTTLNFLSTNFKDRKSTFPSEDIESVEKENCQATTTNKRKLFRSLSFHGRKSKVDIEVTRQALQKSSLRESSQKQRPSSLIQVKETEEGKGYDNDRDFGRIITNRKDEENPVMATPFARAACFKNAARSQKEQNSKRRTPKNTECESCDANTDVKILTKKHFLIRRVSRTRSLIHTKRGSQISQDELLTGDILVDPKQQQRKEKLVKPRPSTDTLLFHDKTMRSVIDTAHFARALRERKHFLKNLPNVTLETTDLCTTEL